MKEIKPEELLKSIETARTLLEECGIDPNTVQIYLRPTQKEVFIKDLKEKGLLTESAIDNSEYIFGMKINTEPMPLWGDDWFITL